MNTKELRESVSKQNAQLTLASYLYSLNKHLDEAVGAEVCKEGEERACDRLLESMKGLPFGRRAVHRAAAIIIKEGAAHLLEQGVEVNLEMAEPAADPQVATLLARQAELIAELREQDALLGQLTGNCTGRDKNGVVRVRLGLLDDVQAPEQQEESGQVLVMGTAFGTRAAPADAYEWNPGERLAPVGCPLLVKLPDGTLHEAFRTGYLSDKEGQIEYRMPDNTLITGRFPWTYP